MQIESTPSVEDQISRNHKSGEDVVRVNFLVPARVRKEWKAAALASDRTLTDLIIAAMQNQLAQTHEK